MRIWVYENYRKCRKTKVIKMMELIHTKHSFLYLFLNKKVLTFYLWGVEIPISLSSFFSNGKGWLKYGSSWEIHYKIEKHSLSTLGFVILWHSLYAVHTRIYRSNSDLEWRALILILCDRHRFMMVLPPLNSFA